MISKIDEMESPPNCEMVALLEVIPLSISHRLLCIVELLLSQLFTFLVMLQSCVYEMLSLSESISIYLYWNKRNLIRRMKNALRSLPDMKPLIKDICLGNIDSRMEPVITGSSSTNHSIQSDSKQPVGDLEVSLNAEQVEQIERALSQEVTLIQGPPGNLLYWQGFVDFFIC